MPDITFASLDEQQAHSIVRLIPRHIFGYVFRVSGNYSTFAINTELLPLLQEPTSNVASILTNFPRDKISSYKGQMAVCLFAYAINQQVAHEDLAKWLNQINITIEDQFHFACGFGYFSFVKNLWENYFENQPVNLPEGYNFNVFSAACASGDLATVEFLWEQDFFDENLQISDADGRVFENIFIYSRLNIIQWLQEKISVAAFTQLLVKYECSNFQHVLFDQHEETINWLLLVCPVLLTHYEQYKYIHRGPTYIDNFIKAQIKEFQQRSTDKPLSDLERDRCFYMIDYVMYVEYKNYHIFKEHDLTTLTKIFMNSARITSNEDEESKALLELARQTGNEQVIDKLQDILANISQNPSKTTRVSDVVNPSEENDATSSSTEQPSALDVPDTSIQDDKLPQPIKLPTHAHPMASLLWKASIIAVEAIGLTLIATGALALAVSLGAAITLPAIIMALPLLPVGITAITVGAAFVVAPVAVIVASKIKDAFFAGKPDTRQVKEPAVESNIFQAPK